ncbi:MAG: hypothetical protein PHV33_11530 [Elusimicrobiales bacterium]|nr:hypothetical protein [Elusimicrobiales bacterium]
MLKLSGWIQARLRRPGGEWTVFFVLGCFAAYFVYYLSAFYAFLGTTLTDFSWGDVSWVHQAFYNFVSDRPLQTSLYYFSGDGVAGNLYPYANQLAMHLNLTPYLLSLPYKISPGLLTLYSTVIAFNVLGYPLFLFLILRHYGPRRFWYSYAALLAVLFSPWFIGLITYKCLFPLYQGVIILALHYAFLKENRPAFTAVALLLLLVSEDAALFMLGYAGCLAFFSGRKFFPLAAAALAAFYTGLSAFVLHPIFKLDMLTSHKVPADVVVRLGKVFSGEASINPTDVGYYAGLTGAVLAISMLLAGKPRGGALKMALALVLVAPSAHWFITFVNGGGHHPMPVFTMLLIAAAVLLSSGEEEQGAFVPVRRLLALPLFFYVFWLGLYALPSMAIDTGTDFSQSRTGIKPRVRIFSAYRYTVENSSGVIASNRDTIAAVRAIPKDHSVVYWTNRTVEGFFVDRSDIWRFPSYYDRADFVVVQKNALAALFDLAPAVRPADLKWPDNSMLNISETPAASFPALLSRGIQTSSWQKAPVSAEAVALLRKELSFPGGRYIIHSENENVLVFKRKVRYEFPMPKSSLGFGWLSSAPRFFRRQF